VKAAKAPSENVIKRLFALSRNVCAFPNCTTAIVQPTTMTVTGKICHIKAKSPGGPRYDLKQTEKERNSFENLILLCGVHHDIVDDQPEKFSVEVLQNMKEMHERNGDIKLSQENARLVHRLIASSSLRFGARCEAQVMVGSPGAIQAKNLTIKTARKSMPSIQPPLDAVGASVEMRSYIEFLIDIYIDLRKQGPASDRIRRPFHPSMIHRDVKNVFGARTSLISQSRFTDLVRYLQDRIDNTIKGKLIRSQGKRNYYTFDEHLAKLHGKP
jgi:hypothetical protein